MVNLDRAKLLDWLGPDIDYDKYKDGRFIPATAVALQEVRNAIKWGTFDVEPYPRAEMTSHLLQSAPDLLEIRKALEAATPGPWQWECDNQIVSLNPKADDEFAYVAKGSRTMDGNEFIDITEGDSNLIANAPTWIAQLLAEVERLQTDKRKLQAVYDEMSHRVEDYAKENATLLALYGGKGDANAALE